MKLGPHPDVRGRLDTQAAETLFLSSVTVPEPMFGVGALPGDRRKDRMAAALEGALKLFANRILPFDTAAARRYSDLAVAARTAGQGFPLRRGLCRREGPQICRPDRRATVFLSKGCPLQLDSELAPSSGPDAPFKPSIGEALN